MNCAELEALICEYVDGTLGAESKALLERHLTGCAGCAELARDAAAAVAFMERAAEVEPPPELVTRILFQIPSRGHARAQWLAGFSKLLGRLAHPILQPRFAMGMAMTILSFSMLGKFAGISPRQLTADDLRPAKIWQGVDDRAHRAWERVKKFYESLRVVYEVQSQLRDWTQQEEEEDRRSPATATEPAEPGEAPAQPGPAQPGPAQPGPAQPGASTGQTPAPAGAKAR